jgi:hypothetical protein
VAFTFTNNATALLPTSKRKRGNNKQAKRLDLQTVIKLLRKWFVD